MIRFQLSKNLRVGILQKPYMYSANVCNTLYYNLCRCKWWNTSALKGYIIGQGVISEHDKFGLIFKRNVLWKHASKVCSRYLSTINRKEKESKAPVWKHRRQS